MPGTLIVSLDFELYWGMRDVVTLEEYTPNMLGGRANIPELLKLFETHGIHATWAVVGFLMAENKQELRSFCPELLPTYQNEKLFPYPELETIGDNEQEAPCFYAPSLVAQIAAAANQELACHTFSHFYCREEGQTVAQFEADLKAALAIAKHHGYEMKSIILPRNQCEPEYTEVLRKCGFTVYRDEESDWIHEKIKFRPLMRLLRLADVYLPLTGLGGSVPKNENGIWNLTGSRLYKAIFPPLHFLEGLKVRRIKGQMLHAAKKGLTFHLWWHPHNLGVRTGEHMRQLEEIFSYYEELHARYGMRSLNMAEAAREAESGAK